jgi:hypothetical protein
MAIMAPPVFPHDLRRRPELTGEKIVYDALAAALDDTWTVHYNRRVKGSRRPLDFLIIRPDGRLIALEVKGGLVHYYRGSFRQQVGNSGRRKRIDPFVQLKRAVSDYLAATGMGPATPVRMAIVFPQMSQAAFQWGPSDHIMTKEVLAPEPLRTWFAVTANPCAMLTL